MFGGSPFGGAPFGGVEAGASLSASFSLAPTAVHVAGVLSLTATFVNAVASASNSFAIVSGPATTLANYVKVDATHATFNITVTTPTGTSIVISDSVSGTNQSIATSSIPATPSAPTVTAGNTTASVAFTAPAANGAAITGYTVTSTPGSFTGTGATSPISVGGLTNGTAYTFTVHATNSNGNSPESPASNSVTPAVPVITGLQKIAPFLSTDTLTAPGYEVYSGAAVLLNALVTTNIATITGVPNGRLAAIQVTPNADGGFYGFALWQTGSSPNVYAPQELYLPPTSSIGATTGQITKLCVFPTGTAMTAPGYQIFQDVAGVYTAVGARITAGIAAIPNVTTGRVVDVTVTLGVDGSFRGIIVWDNGAGVYAPPDEVFIPPLVFIGSAIRVGNMAILSSGQAVPLLGA